MTTSNTDERPTIPATRRRRRGLIGALALTLTATLAMAACQPTGIWTVVLEDDFVHRACTIPGNDPTRTNDYWVGTDQRPAAGFPATGGAPFVGIVTGPPADSANPGIVTWGDRHRPTRFEDTPAYFGWYAADAGDRVFMTHNDDIVDYWGFAAPVEDLAPCEVG